MLHSEPSPNPTGESERPRLLDTLDEGVIVTAGDTIRDCNAAALSLLGMTAEQLRGHERLEPGWLAFWDHGTPLDDAGRALRLAFRHARERGTINIGIHRQDGSRGWMALSCRAARDDEDRAKELFVYTLRDLTAQRELEQENAHYREIVDTLHASYSILEQSPIAMCSIDADGQVVRGNMAFLTLAGAETTSILALVPDEERDALRDALGKLGDGAAPPLRLETRVRGPGGASTWCEITAENFAGALAHGEECMRTALAPYDRQLGQSTAGMALLLGIDRFMSTARALVNMIGNGVATLVISRWEKEIDAPTLRQNLATQDLAAQV